MSKRGRPAQEVRLSDADVAQLRMTIGRAKSPQRDVIRAKIVLMAHEGAATQDIANRLGISIPMVCKWRIRFAKLGMNGLVDAQRKGRPRIIEEAARLELIALACEPPKEGCPPPTLQDLAERAVAEGVVPEISRSHLHRILLSGEVRPHRVKMWLHSKDPEFRAKTNAICQLYREKPLDGVVISVDEKTGIQAIERKYPPRAATPGRLHRHEYEYIRHGTQSLLAAFNVHTGEVVTSCRDRRTQVDLLEFMEEVAKCYPTGAVHVVWDNLNTHRAEKKVWTPFNQRHGNRFHFHFTPLHASWVNQVELWFGIYSRRVLRRASFSSIAQLKEKSEAFCQKWNEKGKPFDWTFRGYHLQTGEGLED